MLFFQYALACQTSLFKETVCITEVFFLNISIIAYVNRYLTVVYASLQLCALACVGERARVCVCVRVSASVQSIKVWNSKYQLNILRRNQTNVRPLAFATIIIVSSAIFRYRHRRRCCRCP